MREILLKTIIVDQSEKSTYAPVPVFPNKTEEIIKKMLRLESVACKDWLTNNVDRSVTGKVAAQQCCGSLHLPLQNLGAVAIDFKEKRYSRVHGSCTAVALINPAHGSIFPLPKRLQCFWAPYTHGLKAFH